MDDIFFHGYLIVGYVVPSGVPECETEVPEPGSPLYKNGPSRGSGSLNQRWSRPERGGYEPHSAGRDRSERPYLKDLLLRNKQKAKVWSLTIKHRFEQQ